MSGSKTSLLKRIGLDRVIRRATGFRKEEEGTMVVFGLTIFVMMLWIGGMAIDFMRAEHDRALMSYTSDRAALAAASLNQPLDCEAVANDYFDKAGLNTDSVTVVGQCSLLSKTVNVSAQTTTHSLFMNLLGIDKITTAVTSTAEENIQDVEISLVLDISGSMGEDDASGNQTKLEALQTAAGEFLDTLLTADNADRVSINVVPYNMQVNAGQDVLDTLNVTNEHDYSHCIDFDSLDFETVEISNDVATGGGGASLGDISITDGTGGVMGTADDLQRTGHFDVYYTTIDHPNTSSDDDATRFWVCPTSPETEVMLMSQDLLELKTKINSLTSGGNTAIDIGVKWGSFFLNPSAGVMMDLMPNDSSALPDGGIDTAFEERPFNYNRDNTIKIMVVMTDGINTTQYMLDEDYAEGDSTLWWDEHDSTWLSHYKQRSGPNNDYFMSRGNYREDYFSGSRRHSYHDDRLTWPEVWNMMGVKYFAYYYNYARDWRADDYYDTLNAVYDTVSSSQKDTRLDNACTAAKEEGVVMFTIGFEVSDDSADVMSDCASSESHFYRVEGTEISDAFSAIAKTIQRLKLTN